MYKTELGSVLLSTALAFFIWSYVKARPPQVVLTVKNLPANAGDMGSLPGLRGFPGGGHGNALQYSCLENPHGQRSLAGHRVGHDWNDLACTQDPGEYLNSNSCEELPSLRTLAGTRGYEMPYLSTPTWAPWEPGLGVAGAQALQGVLTALTEYTGLTESFLYSWGWLSSSLSTLAGHFKGLDPGCECWCTMKPDKRCPKESVRKIHGSPFS